MHSLVLFKGRTNVKGEGELASSERLALFHCTLHNGLALKWEDDAVELDTVEDQETGEASKNVAERSVKYLR